MASSSTSGELSADWVYSHQSNVHVCNHRGWFTEYSTISSSVHGANGTRVPVVGIGTVILQLCKEDREGRKPRNNELRLENVLHTPFHICNIIGGSPIKNEYRVTIAENPLRSRYMGAMRKRNSRRPYGYFAPRKPYLQLVLTRPPIGPKLGPTVLNESGLELDVFWDENERQRWVATTTGSNQSTGQVSGGMGNGQQDFNSHEDLGDPSIQNEQESRERAPTPEPRPPTMFPPSPPFESSRLPKSPPLVPHEPPIFRPSTRSSLDPTVAEFSPSPLKKSLLRPTAAEFSPVRPPDSRLQLSFSATSQPPLPKNILCGDQSSEHNVKTLSSVEDMDLMLDDRFDKETLAWIHRCCGKTRKFMECLELSPYSDDDCLKAVEIARWAAVLRKIAVSKV